VKQLTVVQHTSADYLGLIEDHLEGRRIRFHYHRPFTEAGKVPPFEQVGDGLILLGGGPWGSAGGRDVPTLAEEVALARACFMSGVPIIGIGLGAQIVALACDGTVEDAPLAFSATDAVRVDDGALDGFMPERWLNPVYMRDRPVPPGFARTLAIDSAGRPAAFQIGENIFGFTGHPGFKRAMAEDLIMEFDEVPDRPGPALDVLGMRKHEIADALVPMMTGLVRKTGWMED
jgi:GMP synthase-like glutamine amidotransferase